MTAITRALHNPDVLALLRPGDRLWWQGSAGFLARGVAREIFIDRQDPLGAARTITAAFDELAPVDQLGDPEAGPRAIGALPFDPFAPASLIIPTHLIGITRSGVGWETVVDIKETDKPLSSPRAQSDTKDTTTGITDTDTDGAAAEAEADTAVAIDIASERDPEEWMTAVGAARDHLRSTGPTKVVLARAIRATSAAPFDIEAIVRRLHSRHPQCMVFSVDGFVGASPELLVARFGDEIRSTPMAGTVARSGNPEEDQQRIDSLLRSPKDRAEHQITIDMVHDTLLPWCSYLDWEPEPTIASMSNVHHLVTHMQGALSSPAASVIELMLTLHPTPAVAGSPTEAALELIAEFEHLDRSRYAGPVGWVDPDGNGEWAVGIRSAEIDGSTARLFAGVGVVAGSDPAAELAETEAKFEAFLQAL